jgi:triosephosphate isomerase
MFKTVHEAVVFAKEFRAMVKDVIDVEIVVAPPFTALHAVAEAVRNSTVGVAGQNLHWEREGAFTGEISATMLKEAGAEFVIIGHSERRRLFQETDDTVNRKLMAALGAKLTPIVCIGETLEEREKDQTLSVLDRQIKAGLDGLTGDQVASLVVAYEPVWAIGTGRNATPQQAGEAHAHIRSRLRQWFGGPAADQCHVIYGGSVKPDNIHELVLLPDVDGALVGGASLDVRAFGDIVARSRQSAV